MVTVGKDFCRRRRGDSWTILGFCRPKNRSNLRVSFLADTPPRAEGATNGMIGVSLESRSEDVLRTFVCSTETSWMP